MAATDQEDLLEQFRRQGLLMARTLRRYADDIERKVQQPLHLDLGDLQPDALDLAGRILHDIQTCMANLRPEGLVRAARDHDMYAREVTRP